jgi:hypothetical protein
MAKLLLLLLQTQYLRQRPSKVSSQSHAIDCKGLFYNGTTSLLIYRLFSLRRAHICGYRDRDFIGCAVVFLVNIAAKGFTPLGKGLG